MFQHRRQSINIVAIVGLVLYSSFIIINAQQATTNQAKVVNANNTTSSNNSTATPIHHNETNQTTTKQQNTTISETATNKTTTTPSRPLPKECGCVNNGVCEEDAKTCKCPPKFYGTRCELVVCTQKDQRDSITDTQCKNGYCLRNTQTNEYSCKCNPGHKGALCELTECLDYCYNGGACNDGLGNQYEFELETNKTANLSCICPKETKYTEKRFYGARCEFDKCYEEAKKCPADCWLDPSCKCNCKKDCDDTFCAKLGTCGLDPKGQLACMCGVGYSGKRCNIDSCTGYCFNNGTCGRNNVTIYCNCTENYNGTRCSHQIRKDPESSTESMAQRKSSSVPHVIYGLSITVIICLCLVGIYMLIQKGFFDGLRLDIFSRMNGYRGSSQHAGPPTGPTSVQSNMFFNKLQEDEQAIVYSDIA